MNRISIVIGVYIFLGVASALAQSGSTPQRVLWYDSPADNWNEALPIGNGRIGAMVFGGVANERIQFNEETLWSGGPRDYNHPGASTYLPKIRKLLQEGKQREAEKMASNHFMGQLSAEGDRMAWFNQVRQLGPELRERFQPEFDDSHWREMVLPTHGGWEVSGIQGIEGLDGAVWFRNSFQLTAELVKQDLILDLGKIRDRDFTYLNGELIGSMEGANEGRKYHIPAGTLNVGTNYLAVQVINYYDKGGFVGYNDATVPLAIYPVGTSAKQGVALPTRWTYVIQDENPPQVGRFQADYQPFSDLLLDFGEPKDVQDYRRVLDINNAISTVFYRSEGIQYTREYFVSHPANVLVVRLTADKPAAISCNASLYSPHVNSHTTKIDNHTLGLSLQVKHGALRGTSMLSVYTKKGKQQVTDGQIEVSGADEVIIYLAAATNFVTYEDTSGDPHARCRETLMSLTGDMFPEVRQGHITDYQHYFNTFSIRFGNGASNDLPTDERIERFAAHGDPDLVALYAQYGRYLLISCSRPGTQAANLQGIWNELMTPPWGSKYTTNINAEMNYWPAELTGLSQLHEPFFDLIDDAASQGRKTAAIHYDAPGWVIHHNTDLWRGTAPINHANHGIWLGAPAWFCFHLWERYRFTNDTAFLRERAYPLMKEAARFYQAVLVEDPKTGYLISTPSNSPENGGLVAGPAMDHQLIRSLFTNCIRSAQLLEKDQKWAADLQILLSKVAPDHIGQYGQLQEWLEDVDDPENTHRHVSHLWAVHPGDEINWEDNSTLMEAARKSLLMRGDEGTGWSLAWKINLWARFKDADRTYKLISMLMAPAHEGGGSYPNMLDAHPPFQIDGNFGGTAGIVEMLLQSHTRYLAILPALPTQLATGQVSGIRARGGFIVDLEWEATKLTKLVVNSISGHPVSIKYGDKMVRLETEKGKTYVLDAKLNLQ
ncbi:glycoside hydrolase family 95 protein [Parapedobacter tibetensis]|uniref:glycoside hydrolase family 95 protein n=1 Tax=Parapedobacter tibetensis TaxID=2972951 RepID=UPI00214DDD39|nr:glycoside hydrolase family 95 protein [Parapedobacter tibetensis]